MKLIPAALLALSLTAACPAQILQQAYLKASNADPNDLFDRRSPAPSAGWSSARRGSGTRQPARTVTRRTTRGRLSGPPMSLRGKAGRRQQVAYLKSSDAVAALNFGTSVAVEGDTIVVGSNSGAYVFDFDGSSWTQAAKLTNAYPFGDQTDPDSFGASVAIAGDTIVVGAPEEDSPARTVNGGEILNESPDSGAAYVFVRENGAWSRQAYLKAGNADPGDRFGNAVAISGDTVVVGAHLEASRATGVNGDPADESSPGFEPGAAYVFQRTGEAWAQDAYLKSSTFAGREGFGRAVAISGNTIAVGMPAEGGGGAGVNGPPNDGSAPASGAVYLYQRSAAGWGTEAYVKALAPQAADNFGASVALSRGRLLVGAPLWPAGADQGQAYVFTKSGGAWSQTVFLSASNGEADDFYGISVAMAGDLIAIGAQGEASAARGIDGDQGSNAAPNSGAVYVIGDNNWEAAAPPIPVMSARVEEGADLTVEQVEILSEVALNGDAPRFLFNLAHGIRNGAAGFWQSVATHVKRGILNAADEQLFRPLEQAVRMAESLAPGEIAAAGDGLALHAVVGAADEPEFVALIESGALIDVAAKVGGSVAVNPAGLLAEGARVIGTTELPDGQRLIEFSASVRNAGTEFLQAVEIRVDAAATATPFSFLSGGMDFPGTLAPGESEAAVGSCYAICAAADADAARAALLDGSALAPTGTEMMTFSRPVFSFDSATASLFQASQSSATDKEATLAFTAQSGMLGQLEPGDVLAESGSGNEYYASFEPIAPADGTPLGAFLPLEVRNVKTNGDGSVTVEGRRRDLIDLARSGTFTGSAITGYHGPSRDPLSPPVGNTYSNAEQAARQSQAASLAEADPLDGQLAGVQGFSAVPFHLNEFEIIDGLRISGEVLVSVLPFQFQVTKRPGGLQPQRITMRNTFGVELNLLLECDTGADSLGWANEDQTKQLFDLVLPPIPLWQNAEIIPHIVSNVGAEVAIPRQLTLPLQSSVTVVVETTWDRDAGFSTRRSREVVPLKVSDPAAFDAYRVTANAWAEIGIEMEIKPNTWLSITPGAALRATADCAIAPLEDPWWSLDFGLDTIGSLDIGLLGFPVHESEKVLRHWDLFHFGSGEPLAPPAEPAAEEPVRPLSGKTVRWARGMKPPGAVFAPNLSWSIPVGGEGDTLSGWRTTIGSGIFARLDAEGNLRWMRSTLANNTVGPIGGVPLDDGSATLAHAFAAAFTIANHAGADGARVWAKRYSGFSQTGFTSRGGDPATAEYFLCGNLPAGGGQDCVVAKLDASGDIVWANRYAVPCFEEALGIRVLSDGDLAVIGRSDAPDRRERFVAWLCS
ncbi:MAG: hypothetical protein R3F11_27335 [Verrucomicrobiales bacterium]